MEAKPKRQRTCIGCGKQSDKVELARIVKTGEGVKFDATGRVPGRGAYVCSVKCLETALTSRKLQRALRCGIDRSAEERVLADMVASVQAR